MKAPSILEAMTDPHLFGPWFVAPSWDAWRVALKAVFGLPLTAPELELFQRSTGRTAPAPARPSRWRCSARSESAGDARGY